VYFKIRSECLVKFSDKNKKAKVTDLISGENVSIQGTEFDILSDSIRKGARVELCVSKYGNSANKLFDSLIEKGFADYYDDDVFIEKIRTVNEMFIKNDHFVKFQLLRMGIELTGNCNFDCRFCTTEEIAYRTCGCKKWNDTRKMLVSDYTDLICDASRLGLKRIDFMGGEPLIEWDMLKKLIQVAARHNIISYVFTNGSLINEEMISYFKDFNVHVVVQMFGCSQDAYNLVMNNSSVEYAHVENAVKMLAEGDVNYMINLIVNRYNEDYVENTENYFSKASVQRIYIYPTNPDYSRKYYKDMISCKTREMVVNIHTYQFAKYFNDCLNGNVYVACDGNVYPCEMIREPLGNLFEMKLWEIFRKGNHRKYWRVSKSSIKGCQDCENSINCFDCRALDYCGSGSFTGIRYCEKALASGLH